MKKFILILAILLFGCAPRLETIKREPYPVTVKEVIGKNHIISINNNSKFYHIASYELPAYSTITFENDMTRYQLCFDPEGTELDNWEWCIWTKDDIQEHTTRREVKEYNSTGGDPVRLTIDILDIIF